MENKKQSIENLDKLKNLSTKVLKYINIDSVNRENEEEKQKKKGFNEKVNSLKSKLDDYSNETSNKFCFLKEKLDFLFILFSQIKQKSIRNTKEKDFYIHQIENSVYDYMNRVFNQNKKKSEEIKKVIDNKFSFLLEEIQKEKENVDQRLKALKEKVENFSNSSYFLLSKMKKERADCDFNVEAKVNQVKLRLNADLKEMDKRRLQLNEDNIKGITNYHYVFKKELALFREEREYKERSINNVINKLNKGIEN